MLNYFKLISECFYFVAHAQQHPDKKDQVRSVRDDLCLGFSDIGSFEADEIRLHPSARRIICRTAV